MIVGGVSGCDKFNGLNWFCVFSGKPLMWGIMIRFWWGCG